MSIESKFDFLAFFDYYNKRTYTNGKPSEQRRGQWLFNVLSEYDPDLANKIRNTECDPFYDDAKIEKLFTYLAN